jgi:DNA-binding transcriptional ArsR family regulator
MGEGNSILRSYRELKRYPKEMMERYLAFLDRMYDGYFVEQEDFIRTELAGLQIRHQKILEENRQAFVSEIIKVDFSDIQRTDELKYRFYLGYLNTGRISYSLSDDTLHCFYNYLFEREFDPAWEAHRKARLFKALSDETRIQVLRRIAVRDYYAAELAKELDVTKATMSYHINMLAGHNIVSLRMGSNKRIYYSLNLKKLQGYFDEFVSGLVTLSSKEKEER